jgi:FkbM family methyltransferase
MKRAILGYLQICKNDGILKAIESFYLYYYTKYKSEKIRKKQDFTVNTHGCLMEVNPNDTGLSTELLVFGYHEPDTTKFVSKYIKTGMNCIDVGANIGYYSTLYSKNVGKHGKVISLEPSPINFKFLKSNLENQKMNNFICDNVAAGEKIDSVDFCLDLRANKCFILTGNELMPPDYEIIKVPVKTIDQVVTDEKLKKIDFIKIDVEGYEWKTLEGGFKSIKLFKPTVQIEIHFPKIGLQTTLKIFNFFKDEKYDIIFYNESFYNIFKKYTNSKNELNIQTFLDYLPKHDPKISFKFILENQNKKIME